ncbi:helix-turn-helix transcriptional regulator [Sphingobacterium daejeonense]|uniref:helix-turn-helix transcriptional regulator n=1 Tax=Sphingobacterium daejeonense TaxID=371142 RepID=UPI0010C5731D|nr:MarR family transcriptional regulator [Sphingobacterium daejeonense]VTP91735.1 iron-sulfur cluster biosynthesis transcriptional regulator SufR [Sphingobacterium daejeonense]
MKKSLIDRTLRFIKLNGEITAAMLAGELGITKEGARLKLLKLADDGLIKSFFRSERVGRPITYYKLADRGFARLPDAHAQVTVELLRSVRELLGENAIDLLIGEREKKTYTRYEEMLKNADTLEERLEILARIRTEEGYMAEWKKQDGEYFLIENHCPICAAATECQGFCRAELKNFKSLLGKEHKVERVSHILSEGQRCTYRIKEQT